MPCGFLGNGACPRAYGAKRVRVRIREKEGFTHPSFLRAPCFWGAKNLETARWVNLRALVLKAFSLLRFFVALDKEMTRRHAQWLIVIKKIAHSSRPLTPKAAPGHRPRPLTPKAHLSSESESENSIHQPNRFDKLKLVEVITLPTAIHDNKVAHFAKCDQRMMPDTLGI